MKYRIPKALACLATAIVIMMLATPPYSTLAQEGEDEFVPFTRMVTSDGLIAMSYPTGWIVLSENVPAHSLVFMSSDSLFALSETDRAASSEVSVIIGFNPTLTMEAALFTGATAGENAAILRDALSQLADKANPPLSQISEVTITPGINGVPELASLSLYSGQQFSVMYFWEPVDGLTATAWVFTTEAEWPNVQPTIGAMVRSVDYIGPDSLLEAQEAN